eukprot:8145-Heterococcus_DN1.PRE.2
MLLICKAAAVVLALLQCCSICVDILVLNEQPSLQQVHGKATPLNAATSQYRIYNFEVVVRIAFAAATAAAAAAAVHTDRPLAF